MRHLMANENDNAQVSEEAPKKKSPIIMIIILIIVGLILAGGISFFVATQIMSNNSNSEAAAHHDPGVFVKLGDPKDGILVNVGGVKASRFLKVGIVLEMNPGKKDNINDGVLNSLAETKILDTTLQLLRTVKLEDLEANKQDELKTRLKTDLNKVLGEGSVYDIYITSFILQ